MTPGEMVSSVTTPVLDVVEAEMSLPSNVLEVASCTCVMYSVVAGTGEAVLVKVLVWVVPAGILLVL